MKRKIRNEMVAASVLRIIRNVGIAVSILTLGACFAIIELLAT